MPLNKETEPNGDTLDQSYKVRPRNKVILNILKTYFV